MKISLNDTALMDAVAAGSAGGGEKTLHEAKRILQPQYAQAFFWQEKTYLLIRRYGQERLRKDIAEVQEQLFNRPQHRNFRQKIMRLFR